MNKYLIEILKIKSSVILPGFGALMIPNKRTGKIVLNQLLKFDDGILADYICEKEGIDKTEAKNMISKFIREIEAVIGKGDTYDIFQFGKISKNEKGDLHFEMDESLKKETTSPIVPVPKKEEKPANTFVPPVNKEEKKDESEKEEVKSKPVVKKEESKKVEETEKKETKNSYVPPTKTDTKKENIEKKETSPKVDKETASKGKKDVKAIEAKKKLEAKELAAKGKKEAKDLEDKKKKDAKLLAAKKKEEAKIATAKAKKEKAVKKKIVELDTDGKPVKKKKKRLVPLLLLLICIVAVGYGGYTYQDKIKEMLGMSNVATHTDEDTDGGNNDHDSQIEENHSSDVEEIQEVEDTLEEESEIIEEEEELENEVIEEETIEEVQTVVANSVSGSFHIIGGGFSKEGNATRYADKNNGTVLGRFDNLYLVALKSYDSREDAKSDLSNVQSISSSAWIFKYSK